MTPIAEHLETIEKHIGRGEYQLALLCLSSLPPPSPSELELLSLALQRLSNLAKASRAHDADELAQLLAQRSYEQAEHSSWQIEA